MLSPNSRKEVLDIILKLHKETDITFIMITQYAEETVNADRIIVMNDGKIISSGVPEKTYSNEELIEKSQISLPYCVKTYNDLKKAGIFLDECPLNNERLVELFMPIEIKELSFSYDSKPFIDNLDLKIDDGEMVGIIGNTGCGKSTFVRLIAGLIKSDSGKIIIDGDDITNKKFNKKILRRKLGIVFQFPEMQLFEQTIEKDIFFGLKQYKLTYDEKYKRAKETLELLGLDFEKIKDKSPLALSGGEKRKIAVAGILVCKPKYLIFDEPIAGLDCNSRDSFMKLLLALKQNGTTIIIISHNTDYLAEYADRILVMDGGKIILDDKPNEIFNQTNLLNNLNIGVCNSKEIANLLNKNGFNIQSDILKYDDLLSSIISNIGVIND